MTWFRSFVAVTLFIGSGCSDPLPTVNGRVTLDGLPVSEGVIVFVPTNGEGPTSAAMITDGVYELAGPARVPPGKYTLRITASKRTGRKVSAAPEPGFVEEVIESIPTKYNENSTLEAEITSAELVVVDFALTSE